MVEGMVAAEAEPGPPRALAPGSIAGETHPAARRLLDRPFTDPTPGTEEIRMATGAAKRLASIVDGCQ